MPDFMDLDECVPLFDGFDQFGRAPDSAIRAIRVRMRAIAGSGQHGLGLLCLDTGTAERKGELVPATHGQDGVEQSSRRKNIHGGYTKIGIQGLVNRLSDDFWMPNGVGTVFVCLLYTSPSPRDRTRSRMPSSA